jgi:hypothetical protein
VSGEVREWRSGEVRRYRAGLVSSLLCYHIYIRDLYCTLIHELILISEELKSIREAIQNGLQEIAKPSRYILLAGLALPVLLLLLGASLWTLLLFPAAAVVSSIYTSGARAGWRITAYETVGDIHQLQRSAELAGLLRLNTHESTGGLMSHSQKRKLQALLERFAEDQVFRDDFSIPEETQIYALSLTSPSETEEPILTLNETGIKVHSEGFFEWGQIQDERIARVTHSRRTFLPGMDISAGSTALFRFEFTSGRIEIPVASMDITIWELDLLLYIYRGRNTSLPDHHL